MSDTTTDTTDTTTTTDTGTGSDVTTDQTATDATAPETDYKAEFEKWKALARQNEQRAKDNADKAKRFDELEEANKTELQKAQDALNAANERAAKAERDRLRSDVARTKNVPLELLTGDTEDDLNAAADKLLSWRGTQPSGPTAGGADIGGGSAKPTTYTRDQLSNPEFYRAHRDDILKAQREGRINP